MRPFFLLFLFHFSISFSPLAQEAIFLDNPSFEDEPAYARPPMGWFYCGQPGESPPDIHPGGFFEVDVQPLDGHTYVGMVARDNGTSEGLGQRLSRPLEAGRCYSFSIFAARSDDYWSYSRLSGEQANYNRALRLRAWGGSENCGRSELLWETDAVPQLQWAPFDMIFRPQQSHTHIFFEATFLNPLGLPYNGNILLDKASPLILIDCGSPAPERKPLDTVADPRIADVQALRAFLAEQGRRLRFTVTGAGMEQHLFSDAAGNVQQVNKHLWLMGRALRLFPGVELLIAVGGESEFVLRERIMNFEYTLQAAGAPPQQYQLRPRRRSDDKKEWLWPGEAHEYLIQLILK